MLVLTFFIIWSWQRFNANKDATHNHEPAGVRLSRHHHQGWGSFPRKDDPFHFLPCSHNTLPPRLDDPDPLASWEQLHQPDSTQWLRGTIQDKGLYLCGWLDVPLDYTNTTDQRVARLAVTRFQLEPLPSKRTLVVQPGGPGESGTQLVLTAGETLSKEGSNATFDVLGWDPRGVPATQPSISCFPHDASRDRWKLVTNPSYKEGNARHAMLVADAMNEAVFKACEAKYGDIAGMLSTASNVRDLEQIRRAMDEDQLNGYFVSYGTVIGQVYVNMFPYRAGRLVLDGVVYERNFRRLAGFGLQGLDNISDTFRDGFIGECIDAGPARCALAQPLEQGEPLPTKQDLIDRMERLFAQLLQRPIAGYTTNSGPVVITYPQVVALIHLSLYKPNTWDALATGLFELLRGNAALISEVLDTWNYDAAKPLSPSAHTQLELLSLLVCSDQYDSPLPAEYDVSTNGEEWYLDLWKRMTEQAEIGGDRGFLLMLSCRHWNSYFAAPKEVFRADLDHVLSNPVLLIGTAYDPATPLRNARSLLQEMGVNARLIVHRGYGHLTNDRSTCTSDMIRSYLMNGIVPEQPESQCFADQKPYRYAKADDRGVSQGKEFV